MRRRACGFLVLVLAAVLLLAVGCGNVQLRGEAMTAAEHSMGDAYTFYQKVQADENAPEYVKTYSVLDYQCWRWLVRSAKNDLTYGLIIPEDD